MKALSFYQPRAEQVVRGSKTVDIRSWQTSYRGSLAVHASKERRDERCRALGFDPAALAYGAVVGTVELIDIVPLDEAAFEALRAEHLLDTPYPGAPCYGWRLANPRRLEPPMPYAGRRRLFEVEVAGEGDGGGDRLPQGQSVNEYETNKRMGRPAIPGRRGAHERHGYSPLAPPPEPDPKHPFVLYSLPEQQGGYRVALYQWTQRNGEAGERAPGALWSIELGGDVLRAVADHLLAALRANGYKATDLGRATGSGEAFYLDELTGLRLALILMAAKPVTRHERIEAIGQGVQAMSAEEAYYWFSKCSAGPGAARAQKALRILLAAD